MKFFFRDIIRCDSENFLNCLLILGVCPRNFENISIATHGMIIYIIATIVMESYVEFVRKAICSSASP